MSSFIMSKSEVGVLFDLMGASSIPVGIVDFTEVSEAEYRQIVESFLDNKLIDSESKGFRPDKGLERFLLPIINNRVLMIFNYGIDGTCTFNVSLYFAEGGLVALLENNEKTIKFLTLDSIDDLLLFIPDINAAGAILGGGAELYISYVLVDKVSSIVHCTRIDLEKDVARIVEGKRTMDDATPVEASMETKISEYREMLHNKLREVYNVAGC